MSKQQTCQRYVLKIHTGRLRKNKWKLTLPLQEARKNGEVISLADSQVLRWIDELNGVTDADNRAREIQAEIKRMRKEPQTVQNRRVVKELYNKLDSIQYKPDYLCLIIDKEKDYHRACAGFSINGISYKRLLGTNGGIKNSTIVFVSERLHDEIDRRIENGRNKEILLVPAKLEAYRALACSAQIPVQNPNGMAVVSECMVKFLTDQIYLNDECDGEPQMEILHDSVIELDHTDGFGLMLPQIAERWSAELGLDYVMAGCNTRLSYEKGMLFTFDFVEFAENVAHNYIIKDVWGSDVDVRNVEVIFTESMLKLWDAYDSMDDYLDKCAENGYSIGIPKTCPKELENERMLNYQFIQSYHLSDSDIDELISPTVNQIHDVLGGDWRKTLLYLKGIGLNEKDAQNIGKTYSDALMVDRRVLDDPYVLGCIRQMIRNKINEAKVGVLSVHGNYSIVQGDPYILCQHIFGLEETGILKAGEIYNKYWCDGDKDDLVCFRAPMSCHPNIRKVHPNRTEEAAHWYRYMDTCTIVNAWDTILPALNGADCDGDLMMITDNPVLVRKHRELPAVMCVQRRAMKKVVEEQDIIRQNIESFGNDIGKTTNWVTQMYDVQQQYDPSSDEYKILDYRIMCGQLFQQNIIDKAKGIIAKPMPREWHDRHSVNTMEDEDKKRLYRSIVADKKPYFMRYIYPDLMRKYNTYINNTDCNALREFGMTVDELRSMQYSELTQRQKDFLRYYSVGMPVGIGDCVMNRICRRFEKEFDGTAWKQDKQKSFDYSIYKSDDEYTKWQYTQVQKLYEEYKKRVQSYKIFAASERIDKDESSAARNNLTYEFVRECERVCQNNNVLCNIMIDLCYSRSSSKQFVWEAFGGVIVNNLLEKNEQKIRIPVESEDGDIEFGGHMFTEMEFEVREYGDCFE